MNTKRCLISVVAVFAFVALYEWLVHGVLLMGMYEQTADIWRPKGEENMAFIFLSQILFSVMIAFIFTRNYEGKGIGEGVRFGSYMGLLLASIQVGTYCYLPIPLALTLAWVVAEVLKGIGSGVVLSFTYKN